LPTSLAESHNPRFALFVVIVPVLVVVIVLTLLGREQHGARFGAGDTEPEAVRGQRFTRDAQAARSPEEVNRR
jgi:hypothetical protein